MEERFWLDEEGDCPKPPGFILIEDEVGFLLRVREDQPLFVRGAFLCRWARNVAHARMWNVRSVTSPARALAALYPSLGLTSARSLTERLGDRVWTMSASPAAEDVLAALHGDSPWNGSPSEIHAASWLIWWLVEPRDQADQTLGSAVGQKWSAEIEDDFLSRFYQVSDVKVAQTYLEQWIGLRAGGSARKWPSVDLPATVQERLLGELQHRLAEESVELDVLLSDRLWKRLRNPVALILVTYLRSHPDKISDRWLDWLSQYLPAGEVAPLRRLRPPAAPSLSPERPHDAITWYSEQYLPWREWGAQGADPESLDHARAIGHAFGEWYLATLPDMLVGASGMECLASVRALRLKEESIFVTLLVVVDGPLPRDSDTLLRHIRQLIPALTVVERDWAFSQVPTVTELTKPAFVRQDLTAFAVDQHERGKSASRVAEVIGLLKQARPGELVVWVLVEPDRSYHFPQDVTALDATINKELFGIVGYLSEVVGQVPTEIPLRIVVTADHGRLLGDAERKVAIPPGLSAHGRAAWGPTGDAQSPSSSHEIDGELAWLNPHGYRLAPVNNYCVILDDHAFLKSDGKGGTEHYPHGGLFPEEVFVPWIVLQRNTKIEQLTVRASGEGISGREGSLLITLSNANTFAVKIVEIFLILDEQSQVQVVGLEEMLVPALDSIKVSKPVAPWPKASPSTTISLVVRYRLPDGDERETVADTELTTRTLYQQDDILGGLA